MVEQLKTCPFCGEEVNDWKLDRINGWIVSGYSPKKCKIIFCINILDKEDAIRAWNTRCDQR